MKLYEINEEIIKAFDEAIDPETGELIDEEAYDRLTRLQEDFEEKIENLALYVKDLKAEALALKTEKDTLAKRQKSAERRAASIENYLQMILQGQKRTYTRTAISYRKSEAVVLENEDEFLQFYKGREFIKEKIERTVDKTQVKQILKTGEILYGARLEERQNIQIK